MYGKSSPWQSLHYARKLYMRYHGHIERVKGNILLFSRKVQTLPQ